MKQRFLPAMGMMAATALILCGAYSHLRAQESKPLAALNTRPNLRLWMFPAMRTRSDYSMPKTAALTGRTEQSYAEVFDFYAKKLGAANYDLKSFTTFQPPHHQLITSLGTGMEATSPCYVDDQTMQAALSQRTEHEYISIFLIHNKQSSETVISLNATTF